LVVKGDETSVGDGEAKDGAGEGVDYRLLALARCGDLDDPGFAPCVPEKDEVWPPAAEHRPELAASELGQGLEREEEAVASGKPGAAVGRHPARGDEARDIRVVVQLLGPGMEPRHHAEGAPTDQARGLKAHDKATIAGELMMASAVALISRL